MKKKVCFVIQRYGLEVNGGAELQCRLFAEHLQLYCDVEVITTTAKDYITWKNEYKPGIDFINGIKVYRYGILSGRNKRIFHDLDSVFEKEILGNIELERKWVEAQGPYCPELVQAISDHKNDYDVFIFSTYLYYTTIEGIKSVYDKSILIPEAHNEKYIHMTICKELFEKSAKIFYNTKVEKKFIENLYNTGSKRNNIGGIGIDIIDTIANNEIEECKKRYNLDDYIIYVGRIDQSKMLPMLWTYFNQYKGDNKTNIKLVMVGKQSCDIPKDKNILFTGFVSDKVKMNLMAGAKALILPSLYESLSMVVLEAMSLKTPVIVNKKCEVVKEHCIQGKAGLYFDNYFDFEAIINHLIKDDELRKALGENGYEYVSQNYTWDKVMERLYGLICSFDL